MPYIGKHLRQIFEDQIRVPDEPGQLNYTITKIVHDYIEKHTLCYATINEVIGVLECAKLELYRMVAVPYENRKRHDNGCISELDKTAGGLPL